MRISIEAVFEYQPKEKNKKKERVVSGRLFFVYEYYLKQDVALNLSILKDSRKKKKIKIREKGKEEKRKELQNLGV